MAVARHVRYVAFLRETAILASHKHWDQDHPNEVDFDARVQEVVTSPGWSGFLSSGRSRLDLTEDADLYYIYLDFSSRVFVVVTTAGYPKNLAYQLQDEMVQAVGTSSSLHHVSLSCPARGLQRSLKTTMKKLCIRYDDLEAMDKLTKVSRQTREVADAMKANLDIVTNENSRLLDQMQFKTELLRESAGDYQQQSDELARAARRKLRCFQFMVCLVVLLVLAGIAVVVLKFATHIF